jgi:allantoinase
MMVRSRRVVLPEGARPATVVVRAGRIAEIVPYGATVTDNGPVVDAGDYVILPGLVDSHVHLNEPGRTDWEGFATGTRAAAAGGVTTIVDMPLNSIPATTSAEALAIKRGVAAGINYVDVAFWGGVVPGNVPQLEPLARAGVRGFKCFLSPSGVDEFDSVTKKDLQSALPTLAALGLPLLVHAEWPAALKPASGDPRKYATWLDSRPPAAECAAIENIVALAREHNTPVHIVHLATAQALPRLRAARADGVPITVETCPHYLTFAAEEIADGHTTLKCAPPIRGAEERDALWRALFNGDIDLVASDHSPAPPALKGVDAGDFLTAWGGIASMQLGLSALWSGGRRRGMSLEQIARWMAEGPARLAGLFPRKGTLAPGSDADMVIWDPDAEWCVDQARLHHRHPLTPYHGHRMRGRVQTTILRGHIVFDDGVVPEPPVGRLL